MNIDDEWGRRLAGEIAAGHGGLVTFAVDRDADYRARGVRYDSAGSSFECSTAAGAVEVRVPLPGLFNVYNSLAAIAAAGALGVPLDVAAAALQTATRVPGRFEPIEEGQGFGVLVDYAHTPDSLENVLVSARELLEQAGGEGRLIVVFGAGGDRDREKRPLMGAAARRLADHTLVTSDNPRSEEPEAIIAAIVSGAEGAAPAGEGSALEVEGDRRAAIERAMEMARPGDIVADRGQGPRAGAGVRGRSQGSVRRPRRGARGAARTGRRLPRLTAAVIGLSPTEIARAAGATLVAGAPEPAGATDAPARAVVDSRQAGPGDLFVGSPASARTAARLPRPRSRPARGARS